MQILKKFLERNKKLNQDGFTLLEMVTAVGVLLALSVGGYLAYSGITENTKHAKVESAAAEVLTAANVKAIEGDPEDAEKEYMLSQGDDPKIIVDVEVF